VAVQRIADTGYDFSNNLWTAMGRGPKVVNETGQAGAEIEAETRGTLALFTLNRPKALNALTIGMRARLMAAFPKVSRDPQIYAVVIQSANPKAFSVGSDVREIVALARPDLAAARRGFRDEYALDWQIECFSKPTVSLIDGMVMGGGVGISLYGTHRVAGERYAFAMPETMIGLFPDVGSCHTLARMPGHIGMYLGLTGRSIGRGDAYALGLVTHCIASAEFPAIIAGLADTQPVDPLLDGRHTDPGTGDLPAHAGTIARCFSAASVEEILDRLAEVDGPDQDWARDVAKDLNTRSPLSLKITHRHIQNSIALDLRQVLQIDYRLGCRFLDGHDFYEGARAVLIDKDGQPKWQPAHLADVSPAMIEDYFAPLGDADWALPTRAEMQAARA
jgi:enoyl-CoA hydratase